MSRLFVIGLVASSVFSAGLAAQEPVHVAVEAISLVLDESRLQQVGLGGFAISAGPAGGVSAGRGGGNVRIGGRIGDLDVAAWLELVRRERLAERETTQRVVVLSGSAAEIASNRTLVGPYGSSATAGPRLWVAPEALPDGQIRLRVWSMVGDVRPGPLGTIFQDVPAEGSAEVVVPSGTPVVLASTDFQESSADRGVLGRRTSRTSRSAWIVVRARIVADVEEAFPMPEGIPEEWLER